VAAWLRTPWAAVIAGSATLVALLLPRYRRHRGVVAVAACAVPATGVNAGPAPGSGAQGAASLGTGEFATQGADACSG
jgi:hypothetical protein